MDEFKDQQQFNPVGEKIMFLYLFQALLRKIKKKH